MKIHEYQAKAILQDAGVPVPPGAVAATAEEAESAARSLGPPVAVKAQVLVGGRGKAGAIRLAQTAEEARGVAEMILAMEVKGTPVRCVLIERACAIAAELYLAITLDRVARRPVLLVSAMGGVDIEEVARVSPESIVRVSIDPLIGLRPYRAWAAFDTALSSPALVACAARVAVACYDIFVRLDCSLVEINPLAVTLSGDLVALDAKLVFDDSALARHREIEALRDPHEADPREEDARTHGLSFVALSGNIGCIVNGAGLAMATMDMVKMAGGEPANFLDVGGSSSPDKVLHALRIVLSDPSVLVVLVNIFGGITRCDDIARGLIQARQALTVEVPVVTRLTGTNEREARELLAAESVHLADTMEEAVRLAVRLASREAAA